MHMNTSMTYLFDRSIIALSRSLMWTQRSVAREVIIDSVSEVSMVNME